MQGLADYLISFIIARFADIINFVTAPFMYVLENNVPDLQDYINTFVSFVNNYIFTGFQFIKMAFINIANINHGVWTILAVSIGVVIALYINLNLVKLAYNVWSIFHGSQKT